MSQAFCHISERAHDDTIIIEVKSKSLNDYDLGQVIADEIIDAVNLSQANKIVVDLKNVEYVTSLGLVIFARLALLIKRTGQRVIVCNAAEMVADVLRATHLDCVEGDGQEKVLFLAGDLDDALTRFRDADGT